VIDSRNFVAKYPEINILQAATSHKLLILDIFRDKIQI